MIRIRASDFINHFEFSEDIPDAEKFCIQAIAKDKLSQDVVISNKRDDKLEFLDPLSAANEPSEVFQDLTPRLTGNKRRA